jgi:hypothetical protein
MPQPTISQVHPVNRPLTNISIAYMQSQIAFIASQVFPTVPVDKKSDSYFLYTKNDWFRDEAQIRPPAAESAGSGYGIDTANYNCDVFAFHKDVDEQTAANSDMPLNPARDATQFVTNRLLLRREVQWASDYFIPSVWATDVTPATLWSNYATSDPISDVETGKRAVLVTTGFLPNTLVLGYDVWIKVKNHPDIIDRIKGMAGPGNPAIATRQAIAAMFEVDRLLIAMGVKATNGEGEAPAYSFIQGKHALLCYVNPTPSLLQPSAGYCFEWTGISQGAGQTVAIKSLDVPLRAATRYEGQIAFDNKVIGADLGYFFNGAVA